MMINQLHDMAALYVVDALESDEATEFEIHLADCVECQAEVSDMRSVTEQLSRSVQADPPATLRSAVLSGIIGATQEEAPQRDQLTASRQFGDDEAAPDTRTPDTDIPDNVVALRPRWSSRLPYLVAAAAVVLALGFGGWGLQSHQDAQQASGQQNELVNLLGAGDVQTVSRSVAGGGSATLVLSKSRSKAVFVSAGMPALPSGKVYELWTITNAPSPAGTFTGNAGAVVTLPDAALTAKRVAVTVEPSGGSDRPTTNPVMLVDVPQST